MFEQIQKYGLSADQMIPMLGFAGRVGGETRKLYFGKALTSEGVLSEEGKIKEDAKLQVTRLFSFGQCNALCPYCKRDMQFLDDDGNVIAATSVRLADLFSMADAAMARGEVIRFSGGDPVLFPKVCMAIGEYVRLRGGKGVSIAHNGSGPGFVRKLLPYMSSAAIDIKAPRRFIGTVLGLGQARGEKFFDNSLRCQELFADVETNPNGALLDVRTPVFGAHADPAVPQTTLADMMDLAEAITSHSDPVRTFWTWRMYKPVAMCDWAAPQLDDVLAMMAAVSARYPQQWMGIRAKWHGGGMVYCYGGKFVNHTCVDANEPTGSGNTGECLKKAA